MLEKDIKDRILGLLNEESFKRMDKEEFAKIFVSSNKEKAEFLEILEEMKAEGDLYINKRGKVGSLKTFDLGRGVFCATQRGFGFVNSPDLENDVFIGEDDKGSAFDKDLVLFKITEAPKGNRSATGVIVDILKRANETVVGLFQENKGFGFVVVDNKKFNKDIFIAKKYFSGAKNNDKVVCKITQWPEENRKPEGKVIEVLGQKGDRFVEIDSIVREYGLPEHFPKKVENQIRFIPDEVVEEDKVGRKDFRGEQVYTIDGSDSKDFDDAVGVKKLENGNFELGVHIADVTHYVQENTPLDREALARATSVYLVDKVIPMLPKKLSNGLCSLNPGVDRLTLSCIMEINPQNGKVVNSNIYESIINSKARMTYHEVSELLENNNPEMVEKYKDFEENLRNAGELAAILTEKRERRGAINFDFPESKIKLDETGVPIDIDCYERRTSNKLIEEFMLLANETVAEYFFWLKLPFMYRIHEDPDMEKIERLTEFMKESGHKMHLSRSGIKPSDLQNALDKIEDKDAKQALGRVMLRTLKQARYSSECLGHFGLAASYYTHFTSPIRRYPDLQIHRIIKEYLSHKLNKKRIEHYEHILDGVADQSSTQERIAEQAERDVDNYYQAVYMEQFVGETFTGHISSVTSFGIFVELPNAVEGLARLTFMKDDFEYFDRSQTLVGRFSGKVYKLGQKVEVEVENVNVDLREIDFKILD